MWLNDFFHTLNPVLFSLGPLTIRWYGVAYVAGFIGAGVIMARTAKRWQLDISSDDIFTIMVWIACGVILGGRLGYVLAYGAGYYLQHPLEIFAFSEGGMSFHGGLVGALILGAWRAYRDKISAWTLADLAVIGAPVGLFFGRLANFVNGELWGKPTDLPWGVMFPTGGAVYRHPSQLYEALLEGLVLFIILYSLSRKARVQGTYLGMFLIGYGLARILVEFVRVPDAQLGYLFAGVITMGQLLSVPLVIAGIVVLVRAFQRKHPQLGHYGAAQVHS